MVDYKGQELVERLYQFIIILFSVSCLSWCTSKPVSHPFVVAQAVGFCIGYVKADFRYTFYVWLAGLSISILVRIRFTVLLHMCDATIVAFAALHTGLAVVQSEPCELAEKYSRAPREGEEQGC
jgi:hypothetical protein